MRYRGCLEKAMAPHSSTLAWQIPWTEEPGRLQSMGSLRVGHDWVTSLSLSCTGEGNGNPLQCSCLENPRDRGAWWAAIHGVAQSQTRLKQLSSSSRDQPVSRALQAVFTIWVTREAQFLKILEFQMGSTKPEVIRSPFSKGGCDVTFIEKRVKQSKEIIWWAVA